MGKMGIEKLRFLGVNQSSLKRLVGCIFNMRNQLSDKIISQNLF
jgi:hypothetical protein